MCQGEGAEKSCTSLPESAGISNDTWCNAAACDGYRYCSELLIDTYRWPDVTSTQRNYTYMEAVTRYLGNSKLNLRCP